MPRNWTLGIFASAVMAAGTASPTSAADVTLRNTDNFSNPNNGTGEEPALTSKTGSIGRGSWQADPDVHPGGQHLIFLQGGSKGPLRGGPTSYATPGKNPQLLFADDPDDPGDDVTIGDIRSMSFDTKAEGSADWFIDVFTKPTETGRNDASWYKTNLDFTTNANDAESVNNGFLRHTFSDGDTTGEIARDLRGTGANSAFESFSFSQMQNEFGDEAIRFLALGTSTTAPDDFSALVDNFQFSYAQNGVGTAQDEPTVVSRQIDLEPVPVPASFGLLGTALVLTAGVFLRRRHS